MIKMGRADKVALLGRSGCGKTTLCQELQKPFPRVVIFDRMREYSSERGKPGVYFCSSWKEFGIVLKEASKNKKFRIIFQFPIRGPDVGILFNEALWVLYQISPRLGGLLIVIEEVWYYSTPHFMPEALQEILLTGRHQEIALLSTSQKPGLTNKILLSQCTQRLFGAMDEPNDLKYLAGFLGERLEQVKQLPNFKFLHYLPGTGKNPELISNK